MGNFISDAGSFGITSNNCSLCLQAFPKGRKRTVKSIARKLIGLCKPRTVWKCESPPCQQKFHAGCLMDHFDSTQTRQCPICQEKMDEGCAFARFGRKISDFEPSGIYIKPVDLTEKLDHLNEEDGRRLLIARLVEFRTGLFIFRTGLRVHEMFSGERDKVEVIIEVFLVYLDQMEKFYVEMVPDHLKKTKEYEDGLKLHKKGLHEVNYAIDWSGVVVNPFHSNPTAVKNLEKICQQNKPRK